MSAPPLGQVYEMDQLPYPDMQPQHQPPQPSPYHQGEKISVVVDKDKFVHTRNAVSDASSSPFPLHCLRDATRQATATVYTELTNAFVGLSGAIDQAVKAYVAHTNAVLEEGSTLDVSYLMQPLSNINGVAQLAQQVLQNTNGPGLTANIWPNGNVPKGFNPDGTKQKRQYKPRDPHAPKRPLTAYFRYLQEMRPKISAEIQAKGPNPDGGKAGDISKIATERWNTLPPAEQKPYRDAYKNEMVFYDQAVKDYKAKGGEVDDEDAAGEEDIPSPAEPVIVTAGADEESSDEDSDDSSDDTSDESEEEAPKPAPAPPVKVEPPKKTPKSSKKAVKAGADPVVPTAQFSSLGNGAPAATMVAPSSPSKKRKAEDTSGTEKKKRGRKTNAEKEAEAIAASSSQLVAESSQPEGSAKKEKKKKRKSEAAA